MAAHQFPNVIPFRRHGLPAGFKLWPDFESATLPVTPAIPPVVNTGDIITSIHENVVTQALADLWTNEQWLAAHSLADPTTTKGDIVTRDASAVTRLPVGGDGLTLLADSTQPTGLKWATVSAASIGAVPTTRRVIAGTGLTGGGPLSADVTLAAIPIGSGDIASAGGVLATRQVIAGAGLSGGGALSADVTLAAVPMGPSGSTHAAGIVPDPGAALGATRYLREDATWAVPSGSGGGMNDPTTTKGDLIARGAAAVTRLGVGADGQVLVADSAQALGVKWSAAAASGVSSVFTRSGAVVAAAGDYTAAQVTNAVSVLGSYADPAWITALAWSKITGAPASAQTPWLSNIDGGNFTLSNVTAISMSGAGGNPSLSARSGQFFVAGDVAGIAIEMGTQEASPFAAWIQSKFFGSDGRSFALSLQPLGGNVGIGLTAPAYKLHVTGGGVGAASSFDPSQNVANTICIQDTGAGLYNGGALLFGAGQGLFAAIHGLLTDGSNYTAGAIGFYTRSSPAVLAIAEVMRIMPGGNVGIGNTGPLRSLDLTGGMAERTWSLGAPGSGDLDVTNKGLLAVYGAGTTTFTGLIGGVDGARVTIVNCMASNITFMPSSSSSASQNQIRMTSGAVSLIVKPNGSATFVWTAQFSQWFLVTYFSV